MIVTVIVTGIATETATGIGIGTVIETLEDVAEGEAGETAARRRRAARWRTDCATSPECQTAAVVAEAEGKTCGRTAGTTEETAAVAAAVVAAAAQEDLQLVSLSPLAEESGRAVPWKTGGCITRANLNEPFFRDLLCANRREMAVVILY